MAKGMDAKSRRAQESGLLFQVSPEGKPKYARAGAPEDRQCNIGAFIRVLGPIIL